MSAKLKLKQVKASHRSIAQQEDIIQDDINRSQSNTFSITSVLRNSLRTFSCYSWMFQLELAYNSFPTTSIMLDRLCNNLSSTPTRHKPLQ